MFNVYPDPRIVDIMYFTTSSQDNAKNRFNFLFAFRDNDIKVRLFHVNVTSHPLLILQWLYESMYEEDENTRLIL